MWNLPGLSIKSMPPASVGGFLFTGPPGSLQPASLSQIQLGQELLSACSEQNGGSAGEKQGPRLEGGSVPALSGGLPNSSEQLGGTEWKCPHCPWGGVAYTRQGSHPQSDVKWKQSSCSPISTARRGVSSRHLPQAVLEESLLDLGKVRIRILQIKRSYHLRKVRLPQHGIQTMCGTWSSISLWALVSIVPRSHHWLRKSCSFGIVLILLGNSWWSKLKHASGFRLVCLRDVVVNFCPLAGLPQLRICLELASGSALTPGRPTTLPADHSSQILLQGVYDTPVPRKYIHLNPQSLSPVFASKPCTPKCPEGGYWQPAVRSEEGRVHRERTQYQGQDCF